MEKLIRDSGMTLTSIAKKLGISRVSLNYKMNGKYPFTLNEVKMLCRILNLTDIQILSIMKGE